MGVEGIEVEFAVDVGGAVGAKDVEGEGAESGEVAWFGSNAALVFEEGYITDVVASVFDAPMLTDGGADGGGGQADLRRIKGSFASPIYSPGNNARRVLNQRCA
jgi:hypothetical protein